MVPRAMPAARRIAAATAIVALPFLLGLGARADEGCGISVSEGARHQFQEMTRQADLAAREGRLDEAREIRRRADGLIEEETRKVERVRKAVAEKSIDRDLASLVVLGRAPMAAEAVHPIFHYLVGLNLMNGLNLTADQMKTIVACLKKKRDLVHADEWREVLAAFLVAKDGLERNAGLPKDVEETFILAESAMFRLRRSMPGDEEVHRAFLALADEVERALTDAQKEVIRTFIPCHLPPRETADPVRAGQAEAPDGALRFLVDARRIPKGEFEEWFTHAIVPMIGQRVENYRKHPEWGEKLDFAAEVERVRKLLDEVRSMTDTAFEVAKKDLGAKARIEPEPRPGPTNARGVRERIEMHLLDERYIPLLEARIAEAGAAEAR